MSTIERDLSPAGDLEGFERIVRTAKMRVSVNRVRELLKRLMLDNEVDGALSPEAAAQYLLARTAFFRTLQDFAVTENMIQQITHTPLGTLAYMYNVLHDADRQHELSALDRQYKPGLKITDNDCRFLEVIEKHCFQVNKLSGLLQIPSSRASMLKILSSPLRQVPPMKCGEIKQCADVMQSLSTIGEFSEWLEVHRILGKKDAPINIMPIQLVRADHESCSILNDLPVRMQVRAALVNESPAVGKHASLLTDVHAFTMKFADVLGHFPTATEASMLIFPWIWTRRNLAQINKIIGARQVWDRHAYPLH